MINFGADSIIALRLRGVEASRVYLGGDLVFSGEAPEPVEVTRRVVSKPDSSTYVPAVNWWNGIDSDPMYWHDINGGNVRSVLRFADLGIPAGATIQSATITVYSNGTYSGNGAADFVNIGVEQNATPAAVNSGADLMTRFGNLGGNVVWPVADTVVGTPDTSPDLTELVQEVVDLPGWSDSSSCALLFCIQNNVSSRGGVDPQRHSYSSTGTDALRPLLEITYIP